MAEPKHIPRNAVVVERYQDLASFTQAFAAGHLRLLMVVGPAGTGKSRAMRNAVAGRAAWVDGNATAFGVYCAAFMHQDQPIVLDDVDALYRDANGIRLLKQLCQFEPSRLLGWYSDPQYMERRGIPPKSTTSSSVAIIANRWSTVNADVAALEDIPLVDIRSHLRDEHLADELHPNEAGARIIATEVFRVFQTVHAQTGE